MTSGLKLAAMVAALVIGAPSAYAFEETRGGAAPPGASVAPTAPTAGPGKSLQLDLGGGATAAPSTGTEVRIPGLGKLGILPKLDFGLELLYGVNEQTPEQRAIQPQQGDDGVGIRGTLRHRF
jgi:hypothetical protein